MRTVELTTASWTFSVPRNWEKFEVRFSNDEKAGFMGFVGSKFMALRGSELRGKGKQVDALFNAMVRQGFAKDIKKLESEAHKSDATKLDLEAPKIREERPTKKVFLVKHPTAQG